MWVTIESLNSRQDKIAVVGLGYVGLPLAIAMSARFEVVGFDVSDRRINELTSGYDRTGEMEPETLRRSGVRFTSDSQSLKDCRVIIVAVPTPIDAFNNPDLYPLTSASEIVGVHLRSGGCVVYESTVYPGATEEVCIPILEKKSGLKLGLDFSVGYSPERINPGDKEHTFERIVKVVSGSDDRTLELLAEVYGAVVWAGIHRASSIKVAEAAKVIENTQRDLNIALMNELSMIFDKIGIDTTEVLTAAATKWNFLRFTPGLVGGHCIGVDPYYLTFKAESLKFHPEMILAGRRINDAMGKYVAERAVKMLIHAGKQVLKSKIAILGITFKENVPDLRNTRVVDIISELEDYGVEVMAHDPLADSDEALRYYGISLQTFDALAGADAVIIAVAHQFYRTAGLPKILALCTKGTPIILDLKSLFGPAKAGEKLFSYWRL